MKIKDFEDIIVSLGAYSSAINSIEVKLEANEFNETRKEIYGFMKDAVCFKAESDKIITGEMFTFKVGRMTFHIKQK